MGDGIGLSVTHKVYQTYQTADSHSKVSGRNYFNNASIEQFLNTTALEFYKLLEQEYQKQNIFHVLAVVVLCLNCKKQLQKLEQSPVILKDLKLLLWVVL
jgi:hypothetical protein